MITDEVPVPFIETDEYIEIAVGDDKLGFLSTSNGRWRIYKDYLAKQMRRGCYKMLATRGLICFFSSLQPPLQNVLTFLHFLIFTFSLRGGGRGWFVTKWGVEPHLAYWRLWVIIVS